MQYYEAIVIGSGIAGLSYCLALSEYLSRHDPDAKICLITKAAEDETNTKYAQGGVAVVSDFLKDSYDKHIDDTMVAGDQLSNPDVVNMVIKDGPQRIREIIEWGTEFDKKQDGEFSLGREGGHSENRVLHHKDITGAEIERKLLQKVHSSANIEVLNYHFAIDIITQHHIGINLTRGDKGLKCYGAYVMDQKNNRIFKLLSKVTILATGGMGQVYFNTTNPSIATGDGQAMAYRAGAILENMEFIQFHPTGLYNPGERPSFLISEAVRGYGAILKTVDGKEFMDKYDKRGSLAPRDIVARAIDKEMKNGGYDYVCLDCTGFELEAFSDRFPGIVAKCLSIGIDPSKKMIPVVPTAHYSCGGIKTDKNGLTSINNLYAIGECASTGLHGANRLASNSLLEALVFSHNACLDTIDRLEKIKVFENIPDWNITATVTPQEMVLITHKIRELQLLMSNYVSIVRSNRRLEQALKRLELLWEETENLYRNSLLSPQLCELRNLVNVAYLITSSASERKENRGLHYNIDLDLNSKS